jgi:hypothetical protein
LSSAIVEELELIWVCCGWRVHASFTRVISSSQKSLFENTQHSQETNIHATGGIRNHNLSRRAAADLRLRPRCHWGRHRLFLFNV